MLVLFIFMNKFAPIVLFVYERAWHTEQTINALLSNKLSSKSELFIYSDAAKSDKDSSGVNKVRSYIKTINGFRKVTIIERERNWGLANSIIDGVTDIVNKYGKVIVLEDDLITSPYFLSYMNSALEVYENADKVMHISGYMFPVEDLNLPETIFLRNASCWGWATWVNSWKFFEPSAKILLNVIHNKKLEYEFDIQGTVSYTNMLENQLKGSIDSWAVRWYASVFINHGLCLHPARSLVSNIGHDGSGIHCGETNNYEVEISNVMPIINRHKIKENTEALKEIKCFYDSFKRPFYLRVFNKLLRILKNMYVNVIKI